MTARAEAVSPFRGLAAFGDSELDALMFFGRTRETEVIAANVQAARLTVLHGPSGVGKSSILHAGVARRLRAEDDVDVAVVDTWSGDPALFQDVLTSSPDDRDLYVILDQFEEYFVYHADDVTLPRCLAEVIGDRGRRVNILIGIRDDALAQLDSFRAPVPQLLGNRLRLERLDRESGREAIVGPIARYNMLAGDSTSFEPRLVEAILDEVSVERDRIEAPLLQLVLERLWEARRDNDAKEVQLETLRELGGASHIVHDHLDRAMSELSADDRLAAAAMYDHLVTPSGTKIAQRAGDLARYANVPETDATAVLDKLAQERILRTTSENGASTTRFEIYHDVLAAAIRDWLVRHETDQQVAASERRRRRAVAIATAALLALLVVAAIAIFALLERRHADAEAAHARAGEQVADARSDLSTDPAASLAAALSAAQKERSPQVEALLRDALIASHVRAVLRAPGPVVAVAPTFAIVGDASGRIRKIDGDGRALETRHVRSAITSAAVGPSGSYAAGSREGVIFESRPSGPVERRLAHGAVTAVALAANATAAGSGNGSVAIWRQGRAPFTFRVRGRVQALSFSPDARLLLVVSHDRHAELVDVKTGKVAHTLTQRGFINAGSFDPGGQTVATASADRTGRLWSATTGRPIHTFGGATQGLTAVAFGPRDNLVAFASGDGVSRVYDRTSGALRFYLSGDTNAITDIDFDPTGRALVTSSADRSVRIWTTDVGRLLFVLHGHNGAVVSAAFTANGNRVLTSGADATVRLWDPAVAPELRPIVSGHVRFVAGSRRRDGTILLVDQMHRGLVLDPNARRVRTTIDHAAVAPPTLAVANGVTARVDGAGGIDLVQSAARRHIDANANAVALSPDGTLLAAGSKDGYLRVWSTSSGQLLHAVVAHQGPVRDVVFSPDGRWIVTAGPISAGLWSASTGRQLLLLRGPTKPVRTVLFTSNGRTIVAAGNDGAVRRYDCVVCGTLSQLIPAARAALERSRPR